MDKYLISIKDIDNLNGVTVYNKTKQKEEWYTDGALIRLINEILKERERKLGCRVDLGKGVVLLN